MTINVERMNAEIRKYIPLIIRQELNDPKIGMVCVNEVKVAKDNSFILVYVSFLGAQDPQENLKVLKKSAGRIRSQLSKRMSVRHIPPIQFEYDDLYDKVSNLDKAIKS